MVHGTTVFGTLTRMLQASVLAVMGNSLRLLVERRKS